MGISAAMPAATPVDAALASAVPDAVALRTVVIDPVSAAPVTSADGAADCPEDPTSASERSVTVCEVMASGPRVIPFVFNIPVSCGAPATTMPIVTLTEMNWLITVDCPALLDGAEVSTAIAMPNPCAPLPADRVWPDAAIAAPLTAPP